MYKIVVAHPEKQHSYRMAAALKRAGVLFRYITTSYYKKFNFTWLVDTITKGRFRLSVIRKNNALDDDDVKQLCELRGLFLLFLRRKTHGTLINRVQNKNFDAFGRKVARYAIKNRVDAVIAYDTNSLVCFKELRGTGIVRIMDTSIANRAYTKSIYGKTITNQSDWDFFSEKSILLDDFEMGRLQGEIGETDYFIVPSQFVCDSLAFSGVERSKIYIAPYGVDCGLFEFSQRRAVPEGSPLKLLFVGECSYRKGLKYLLDAVSHCGQFFDLTIVGSYARIPDLYDKYKSCDNIHFEGRVAHDLLPAIYQAADLFVLPSLSEGMSLVGLEAMASGLPIVCSKNCGVNDLVVPSQNGWIMEEISTEGVLAALMEAYAHKNQLQHMGMEARKTAEQYNWKAYEQSVQRVVMEIMSQKSM